MEKIIAVVIMLVIVIGLIATVVMPQANQITTIGEQGTEDMTRFQIGTQEGKTFGNAVINDFRAAVVNENIVIRINADSNADYELTEATTLAAVKTAVDSNAVCQTCRCHSGGSCR